MKNELVLPRHYNYIAAFLTFACNARCSYCINRFGGLKTRWAQMTGKEWVAGLNRIRPRDDLPVTLQGGEPSLHPDFAYIINHLRRDLHIDILTNLRFDTRAFIRAVDPARLRRPSPYASIRVSFHPETMELGATLEKVTALAAAGYSIGVWAVAHPAHRAAIAAAGRLFRRAGVDFRLKEFLGRRAGRVCGTYKYPGALRGRASGRAVECRGTELIVAPDGNVFRCHGDLYARRQPVGRLGERAFQPRYGFAPCRFFGACNPCDVKIKTDRHQEYGHTSVEIRGAAE